MSAQAPSVGERVPPIGEIAIVSLALVVIGGIDMAAQFPSTPALGVPVVLLTASAVLLIAGVAMLLRLRGFAWPTFRRVGAAALAAYVVSAGMIAFAFVHNGAAGTPLLVILLMLVIFALDVPLVIAFTVARFQHS